MPGAQDKHGLPLLLTPQGAAGGRAGASRRQRDATS